MVHNSYTTCTRKLKFELAKENDKPHLVVVLNGMAFCEAHDLVYNQQRSSYLVVDSLYHSKGSSFIEQSCKLYLSKKVAEELHSKTSLHH